jgi:hypothetical protein
MEWNWKWLRGFVGMEVRVVVGKLLDVVLDQTVYVPFEHRTIDVEAEFLNNVLVDAFGVRRAAHAFDTEELEVALFKVVETVTGEHVIDSND